MMGFGYGNGYMMGGWGSGNGYGYGSGYGGGFLAGLIGFGMQILSLLLLVVIGVVIFRWIKKLFNGSYDDTLKIASKHIDELGATISRGIGNLFDGNTYHDALNIASERYARGEISTDEYFNLKKNLLNV